MTPEGNSYIAENYQLLPGEIFQQQVMTDRNGSIRA
jgi:hypothetical protein